MKRLYIDVVETINEVLEAAHVARCIKCGYTKKSADGAKIEQANTIKIYNKNTNRCEKIILDPYENGTFIFDVEMNNDGDIIKVMSGNKIGYTRNVRYDMNNSTQQIKTIETKMNDRTETSIINRFTYSCGDLVLMRKEFYNENGLQTYQITAEIEWIDGIMSGMKFTDGGSDYRITFYYTGDGRLAGYEIEDHLQFTTVNCIFSKCGNGENYKKTNFTLNNIRCVIEYGI